jgi:SAM-dependent methyltransferase
MTNESAQTATQARADAMPACPLCENRNNDTVFTEKGHQLRFCVVCELFFIHPYPQSGYRHEQVVDYSYEELDLLDPARSYAGEKLYYDRHFPLIAEECSGASSVLDVGCGTGNLLERLQAFPNLRRVGIELNQKRADYARRTSGCEIHMVPFEEFTSDEKFDVITMMNVLSHIPSFDGLFNTVQSLLNPGGKLILRTSEMSRKINKWSQLSWGIPDDLHFLGLGTLDFVCRKYGFRISRRVRTLYSDELFRESRMRQPGRSRFRNTLKSAVASVPLALPTLKKSYEIVAGRHLYLSFIVLTPAR